MLKNAIIELLETVFTSIIVIFVIYTTIALPEQVQGASMEPNFHNGERILVEKITKHYKSYETGDVVVLHPPQNQNLDYIKRVIAIPGDIVQIFDCNIYINREGHKYKLDEPYLQNGTCTFGGGAVKEGRSVRLEKDQYMVLGDNRPRSADSRSFGFVQKQSIVGRVVFKFWPISEAGYVK